MTLFNRQLWSTSSKVRNKIHTLCINDTYEYSTYESSQYKRRENKNWYGGECIVMMCWWYDHLLLKSKRINEEISHINKKVQQDFPIKDQHIKVNKSPVKQQ